MFDKRSMGVSENRGPQYSTLNSRILIIRTPKEVHKGIASGVLETSERLHASFRIAGLVRFRKALSQTLNPKS